MFQFNNISCEKNVKKLLKLFFSINMYLKDDTHSLLFYNFIGL